MSRKDDQERAIWERNKAAQDLLETLRKMREALEPTDTGKPPIRVETYDGGTAAESGRKFEAGAQAMAAQGYSPASQTWQGATLTVAYQLKAAPPAWEYRQFEYQFPPHTFFKEGQEQRMREAVQQAALALVSEHAADGWQPTDPVNASMLFKTGCVEVRVHERDSWLKALSSASGIIQDRTLVRLKMTMRRLEP